MVPHDDSLGTASKQARVRFAWSTEPARDLRVVWWTVAVHRMDDDGVERKESLSLVAQDVNLNATDNILLAPFNPTCDHAQQVALEMLLGCDSEICKGLKNGQQQAYTDVILFDLGCGDGRLLIRAVQCCLTVRCIGIERDPALVNKALAAIRAQLTEEQQSRIEIRSGDALMPDFAVAAPPPPTSTSIMGDSSETTSTIGSKCQGLRLRDATALYLYLLPKGLVHIQQQLLARDNMPQLSAVVTYMFRFKQWEPMRVDRSTKAMVPVYLYKVD